MSYYYVTVKNLIKIIIEQFYVAKLKLVHENIHLIYQEYSNVYLNG